MPLFRLDKLIADSGLASRSEARSLIRVGRVTVSGAPVISPEARFDPDSADIRLDGRPLRRGRSRYIMMDKPRGVLSATEDAAQKTVLDLLPEEYKKLRVFPVGRLDRDTTGLLLITNDGDFTHRIITPGKLVPKLYLAGLDQPVTPEDARAFAEGLWLRDGTRCLPAELLPVEGESAARVVVFEGKYHQVKRMLASRGKRVESLRRLSIGALRLDESLGPGGFRELSEAEKSLVFQTNYK